MFTYKIFFCVWNHEFLEIMFHEKKLYLGKWLLYNSHTDKKLSDLLMKLFILFSEKSPPAKSETPESAPKEDTVTKMDI